MRQARAENEAERQKEEDARERMTARIMSQAIESKRKASDAARSGQRGAQRAANSMPRAPSLSKDAVFWFAVIAALAFLPTLISVLSGPVQAGGGGVYV